jgi:hypothetical protein
MGFLHSWYAWRLEGFIMQTYINAAWAILDCAMLFTYIRFGKKDFNGLLHPRWFLPWSLLVIAVSFILQYSFVIEYGLSFGRAYAAFLQNLVMSVLFIDMLVRRGGSEGQSMTIAVSKWLGTLAPTILVGVLGGLGLKSPNRFILVTGLLCSLFDLIYIAMLARAILFEKRKAEFNSLK